MSSADEIEGYLYADEALERELGIQFESYDHLQADKLLQQLQVIADRLGYPLPEEHIHHPPKGFWLPPKDTEKRILQRRVTNAALSTPLAERNAEHQDQLKHIPIDECEQRMVSLVDVCRQRYTRVLFSKRGFHPAAGEWAGRDRMPYLRLDVAHKLAGVFFALNEVDLQAHVEDCWRPESVQRGLFFRRIIDIAQTYPSWSWEQVKVVSSSLTASSPGMAGHQAGAAIDWRIFRLRDEKPLDLGNEYAQSGAVSSLDFPYITARQWRTRTLFAVTMHMAGLKLLRTENWHASHGDRGMGFDGAITMHAAHYGPLQSFELASGTVLPYDELSREVPYFDEKIEQLVTLSRQKNDDGNHLYSAEDQQSIEAQYNGLYPQTYSKK